MDFSYFFFKVYRCICNPKVENVSVVFALLFIWYRNRKEKRKTMCENSVLISLNDSLILLVYELLNINLWTR